MAAPPMGLPAQGMFMVPRCRAGTMGGIAHGLIRRSPFVWCLAGERDRAGQKWLIPTVTSPREI